jgi:hypothetical protein
VLGISDTTVRRWISLLEGTMILRIFQPWFENAGKRIVKNPKLFISDSGLFHFFQGIETMAALESHPKLGASWEGFALEELRKVLETDGRDQYFWATHGGAELDLFFIRDGKRIGCEFKHSDAPAFSASMAIALRDLALDRLFVVVPSGPRSILRNRVEVVSLPELVIELASF